MSSIRLYKQHDKKYFKELAAEKHYESFEEWLKCSKKWWVVLYPSEGYYHPWSVIGSSDVIPYTIDDIAGFINHGRIKEHNIIMNFHEWMLKTTTIKE